MAKDTTGDFLLSMPFFFCSPILRTDEEHENVFKTMKHIPDIAAQLSDVELRELSTCVIREFWVKGSAGRRNVVRQNFLLIAC